LEGPATIGIVGVVVVLLLVVVLVCGCCVVFDLVVVAIDPYPESDSRSMGFHPIIQSGDSPRFSSLRLRSVKDGGDFNIKSSFGSKIYRVKSHLIPRALRHDSHFDLSETDEVESTATLVDSQLEMSSWHIL
jgi:hypothetical protein